MISLLNHNGKEFFCQNLVFEATRDAKSNGEIYFLKFRKKIFYLLYFNLYKILKEKFQKSKPLTLLRLFGRLFGKNLNFQKFTEIELFFDLSFFRFC